MAYPHYRSQFGDTTFTKVFVGGLAWETPTEEMRKYFEQFGEILEAVIINDKITGKSKGYGFVTFRDPESARKACADPNPKIDGRRANCNIAALGRSRPSPPRGRTQGGSGSPYHGGGARSAAASPGSSSHASVGGMSTQPNPPPLPPPLPPPHPVFYSPYGFQPYSPEYSFHPQAPYGPLQQSPAPYYHHQVYGSNPASPSSSAAAGAVVSPYYYGYSPSPRGTYGPSTPTAAHHRPPAPSYLFYPPPVVPPFQPPPPPTLQPLRSLLPPTTTDSRQTQTTPLSSSSTEQQQQQQHSAVPTSTSVSEGPAS